MSSRRNVKSLNDPFNHRLHMPRRLREVLGDDAYARLLDAFGGVRMFVPLSPIGSIVDDVLGIEIATLLCAGFAGDYIKIPLDKEFVAFRARLRGASHRDIARLLYMTESGVERLLWRLARRGEMGSGDLPRGSPASDVAHGRA